MSVTEKNRLIEIVDENGNVEREFPITKAENIIGLKDFVNDESNSIQVKALKLLAANPYIIDDTTKYVYRIGIESGNLYRIRVDSGVAEVINSLIPEEDPGEDEPGSSSVEIAEIKTQLSLIQESVNTILANTVTYEYDAVHQRIIAKPVKNPSEDGE